MFPERRYRLIVITDAVLRCPSCELYVKKKYYGLDLGGTVLSKVNHWMKKHRTKLSLFLGVGFLFLAKPTPTSLYLCIVPIVVGESIRIWSSGHIHKNQVLTVTGPYSLSRNPLYVGSFILGFGFMVAMGVLWLAVTFLLFYASVYWFTIRWEEDKLAKTFPDECENYFRDVPRFLPFLNLPVYRRGEFSWSQVTKYKELQNASVVVAVYVILWGKMFLTGG
jgi:protein-S-isoprenylcysteine O-methyltransferase Ste14